MCWDLFTETRPKARKAYPCDAAVWIINAGLSEDDVRPDDWKKIKLAESQGWKILPGQTYVKIAGIFDGEWSVFRGRPELCDICFEQELYF